MSILKIKSVVLILTCLLSSILVFTNYVYLIITVPLILAVIFSLSEKKYISFLLTLLTPLLNYLVFKDIFFSCFFALILIVPLLFYSIFMEKHSFSISLICITIITSICVLIYLIVSLLINNGSINTYFINEYLYGYVEEYINAINSLSNNSLNGLPFDVNELYKEVDFIVTQIPALIFDLSFVIITVSLVLSSIISFYVYNNDQAITIDRVKIPKFIGYVYILALLLFLFANGLFSSVLNNFILIFEIIFAFNGLIAIIYLIKFKRLKNTFPLVVIFIIIFVLTSFNILSLLSIVGVWDCISNRTIRKEQQ